MVSELTHRTWGVWPSVVLAGEAVELEVVNEVGARVVSLRDKRRGREWLSQGRPPDELEQMAWASEGARFSGRESFGWDECLPTTSPCPDPLAPAGPPLRDHGDQWGRGAYVRLDHELGTLEHSWSAPRWPYRFHRRLSLADDETVLAEYLLESQADVPLPVHWALHPVLSLEPGSYLDLPEVARAVRTWQHGIDLPAGVGWPRAETNGGAELDLACVRRDAGWAAVLYADPRAGARVVAPDGARLELEWDRAFAPVLRIWLSYGGWPPGEVPVEQVALEPCTSCHDDLESALAEASGPSLPPRGELRWWARLRLS